ncbi:cell division control protein [Coemansia sp. RSA 1807]|nr:cell division control protein [Coemansia sp. RSA 564]KAJ2228475.1 cell division control protein [Coemansia sp. RSA 518]KAJ2250231.1 cell division control protein [Coemansia sp. RSA 475]KAJ2405910.1 cell division control protein [Coemansia sp. RSA 2526]KAJ2425410.1 cell division control protein [Coemansia sp. RSA 2524]KAJ2438542.1 cell division control protein [Coemansia sp. RSA 2440]KAJ2573109.1 cell division control protein [Coemansia sp. RSA 1807]KAJ2646004.1 cell division control prote
MSAPEINDYVGFDTITQQMERKFLKRGFNLNVILVGESGMGKSTLVNSIFSTHLVDSQGRRTAQEVIRKTTEISPVTQTLEENGVRVQLTIIDTPGFGDQCNNEGCWVQVIKYIKDQHAAYLESELKPQRARIIEDSRVHACLYFLNPGSRGLRPLDVEVLRRLTEVTNVIPVIAKADSMTTEERTLFKRRVKEEMSFHRISVFPYASDADNEEDRLLNASIRDLIPFAVVGSEESIDVDGKPVRGRRHGWGVINIFDETHCDFVHLRNFMLRTHLSDLIEVTAQRHYEQFRTSQLRQIKELRAQQAAAAAAGSGMSVGAPSAPLPHQPAAQV